MSGCLVAAAQQGVGATLKVFDLFCGGGGFSRGVSEAGRTSCAGRDIDPILSSAHERKLYRSRSTFLPTVRERVGQKR